MTELKIVVASLALVAASLVQGCATKNDVEMAKIVRDTATEYYHQADHTPLLEIEGSNVTYSITGARHIVFYGPVIPKSIYPRDASTLDRVMSGVERVVPWGVAGVVGSKLATPQKPTVVNPTVVTTEKLVPVVGGQ